MSSKTPALTSKVPDACQFSLVLHSGTHVLHRSSALTLVQLCKSLGKNKKNEVVYLFLAVVLVDY